MEHLTPEEALWKDFLKQQKEEKEEHEDGN